MAEPHPTNETPTPPSTQPLFHEQVAAQLIEQLRTGTAPWQKPWAPGELERPYNPVSSHVYRGVNVIHLMAQGQADPRWMTYQQAQQAGAQVRAGEKGTTVQYWKFEERRPVLDDDGQPQVGANGKTVMESVALARPKAFFSTVFNASQIDGLPEREVTEPAWDRHQRADTILAHSGATLHHDQQDRAFYRPASDTIHLPGREQFASADTYYATALHELGHWSGHKSRLDRDLSGAFGSARYAQEELRAEIASLMLGDHLGIGHDPGQHAAYVGHWIQALQDDPKEILRASRDAEQIMGYVLGLEQARQQEQQVETESEVAPALYTILGEAQMASHPDFLVTAHAPSARLAHEATGIPVVLAHEGQTLDAVAEAVRDAYPQHQGWMLGDHSEAPDRHRWEALAERTGMPVVMPELSGTEVAAGHIHLLDYAVLRGESCQRAVCDTIETGIENGKETLARRAERQRLLDHLAPIPHASDVRILGRIEVDDVSHVLISADPLSADAAARATGVPVVIAPSPEALPAVAMAVQAAFPDQDSLVLADLVPEHQAAFAQACDQAHCEAIYPDLSEQDVAMGHAYLHDYFDCYPQDPWQAVRATLESGIAMGKERLAWRAMTEPEAEIGSAIAPEVDIGQAIAPESDKTWLYVPVWETEAAEALGAQWDAATRSHYVDAGTDLAPFATWAVQHWLAEAEVRPATLNHPYFAHSGLHGEPGARETYFEAVVTSDDRVLAIARDASGREQNLYDLETGTLDARLPSEGVFAWAGKPNPRQPPEALIVTTDYLSGRAAYEATGIPAAVAFAAENLPAVAQAVRQRYPEPAILILGGADQERHAAFERDAAARCGGERVTPTFRDAEREAGHQTLYDFYRCRYPHIARDIRQTLEAGLEAARMRQAEPVQELAAERVTLHVPYVEKDDAKALGAKWDAHEKQWYAPEGTDLAPLSKWREPAQPPRDVPLDPHVEFGQALQDRGLVLDGLPVMDGNLHRVRVEGGAPGRRDGAYVGHLDGRPAGYLQNHKTGVSETWKAKGYTLSRAQHAALQAEAQVKREAREQARQAGYARSAEACQALWQTCVDATAADPYLLAKGVGAYGVRSDPDTGKLVVPARNVEGEIRSVQIVDEAGKRFYPGAQKSGHFHQVGERQVGEPILIAEGYATAASIHEATGRAVIVAFDASNLQPVADALRAREPEAPILICGDNDHHLGDGAQNVGRHKAEAAAKAVGGCAMVPSLTVPERQQGKAITDFNDLHQSRGLAVVQRQIEASLQRLLQVEKARTPALENVKARHVTVPAKGVEMGI